MRRDIPQGDARKIAVLRAVALALAQPDEIKAAQCWIDRWNAMIVRQVLRKPDYTDPHFEYLRESREFQLEVYEQRGEALHADLSDRGIPHQWDVSNYIW